MARRMGMARPRPRRCRGGCGGRRRCGRHHRVAASRLCGLPGLCAAGLRAGLLLGVSAGVRCFWPGHWLQRPSGAGLPRLPAAGRCGWSAARPARSCCWSTAWPVGLRGRPAAWPRARPARRRRRSARGRSGRLLRAALSIIRSANRDLSGLRRPAPSLPLSSTSLALSAEHKIAGPPQLKSRPSRHRHRGKTRWSSVGALPESNIYRASPRI